jgi:hypothetical protein
VSRTKEWCLVSSRGAILFYIAVSPSCTVQQIADAMSLTRRSVYGIVVDLKRAGMITTKTVSRRHQFAANMEASFLHPTLPEFPLGVILDELASLRDDGGQATTKMQRICTKLDQLSEVVTSSCPRPGCSGSLISSVDGNTCLLCGRDPDGAQPNIRHNRDGRMSREALPGGGGR